jgi:hypothetical protein
MPRNNNIKWEGGWFPDRVRHTVAAMDGGVTNV